MNRYEYTILGYIQNHMRNKVFDVLMPSVSLLGNYGFVWIVLMIIMLFSSTLKAAGYTVFLALALHVIFCNIIIKPLFSRIRPIIGVEEREMFIDMPSDSSFPSGHTCSSFAVTTVLYLAGSTLFYPALILACCMAFSRLYLYVHYPTDVMGGIALGFVLGFSAFHIMKFIL